MSSPRDLESLSNTETPRATGALPESWKLVRVNEHFDALIAALEYAESKGFLPDALRAEWENFACDENIPVSVATQPDVSQPQGVEKSAVGGETEPPQGGYSLDPAELKISTLYTRTGGGFAPLQDNGVRVLHVPTGIAVEVATERSQHRNRAIALERLAGLVEAQRNDAVEVEPTAFASLSASGKVTYFDGKPMLSTVQNPHFPTPLYTRAQPRLTREQRESIGYAALALESHADDKATTAIRVLSRMLVVESGKPGAR
jgi:hypothetical protein